MLRTANVRSHARHAPQEARPMRRASYESLGRGSDMRGIRAALIAFLVLGSVGCAATQDPATPPPRAERPTYAVGEKWIRTDGVYELVRIEDDRYIFSAGPDREIHLTRDLFPATVVKGVRILTFSPPPRLPWPLEVGKVETGRGVVPGVAGFFSGSYDVRVEAYEDVRVPAGTFKAFRVSIVATAYLHGVEFRLTTWYAPALRQFVKTETRRISGPLYGQIYDATYLQDFELVAFD